MELAISLIKIRTNRHRGEFKIDDLVSSFSDPKVGQLHNIVVEKDGEEIFLVAGQRRLATAKHLNWETIRAVFREDLTLAQKKKIELEENVARNDLTWQERYRAVAELHEIFLAENKDWSMTKTAERIGMSQQSVSDAVIAMEEIEEGNSKVAEAPTKNAALSLIRRKTDRAVNAAISDLMSIDPALIKQIAPTSITAEHSILNENFTTWAAAYDGKPFNFIHCDFPYGINLDTSAEGKSAHYEAQYSDTSEVFFSLIDTLVKYQYSLLSDSASIMFWFDMAQYQETFAALSKLDFNIYQIPLIWVKSDGKGILSDPARRARHTYETAFYGHRGTMKNVQSVFDTYSCPTDKTLHQSQKPQPMLEHFFRMFVDKTTRILDPTCGSASALRAAETLDAEFVLGLEREPLFVESARRETQQFRNKRILSEKVK